MAGDRRCARLLSAAFAILILLSACSAQPEPEVEETAAPETGETDWVYVPEFTRLAGWAGCFALAGERLYFDGVETLASGQETGGAVTRPILRSAPALGGEVSDLASFEAAPTPESASVSGGISCMCALPDGGFAAVERAFFSMPEPMEETPGATSSDLAAGFESAESHILHIFDAAGESRAVKDITELLGGEGVEACAADAAGYIYLLTSGGGALVLDRGGGFVSRSAGEGGFSGLVRLGEKVCALLNTQEGISLLPIDPVGAAAGKEELLLPASAQEPYPGTEHALLWSDGERLLGLAPGEEEPEELLYFSDAGLDGDMLAAVFQEEGWSEQHCLIPGQGTQSYDPDSVGGESFTHADAQLLLAAIDGAKGLYGAQDEELLGIVNEEAGRFFAGDCTAEQCAAVIQDRASIYINERR